MERGTMSQVIVGIALVGTLATMFGIFRTEINENVKEDYKQGERIDKIECRMRCVCPDYY